MIPNKTIKTQYRVERKEIGYIKFIFEAYDGLVVLRTIDPEAGLIELCIAPGCENDVEAILDDLKKEILIENRRACPESQEGFWNS